MSVDICNEQKVSGFYSSSSLMWNLFLGDEIVWV